MKKVSIVILNWNGSEMLRRFLPSVISYSKDDNIEICVADNGSTDQSVEIIKKEFPAIKIIQLMQNWGFAEGYNKAIQQIDAEYVMLLNSDVEVTENWLSPLISFMDMHSEVSACQPKILSYNNKTQFEYAGACGGYMDKYGYPFCRGRVFNQLEYDNGQYDEIQTVFWATGAALFIRLEDYKSIGGFDGRFFAHMEEIDLCWRLQNMDKKIVCIPQSKVYHVGGATLSKENPRKTYLNFRNNLLMLYKNTLSQDLTTVMRLRLLLDYIAIVKYILTADFMNAKAIYKARRDFYKLRNSFIDDRIEIQHNRIRSHIKEMSMRSVLWQFYFISKKKYSQLTGFNVDKYGK